MSTSVFSIKSMYEGLINGHTKYLCKYLWKVKIPHKIRAFIWFLSRKCCRQRVTLLKESGKDVRKLSYVTRMRQLSICSSLVLLLVLFGV